MSLLKPTKPVGPVVQSHGEGLVNNTAQLGDHPYLLGAHCVIRVLPLIKGGGSTAPLGALMPATPPAAYATSHGAGGW